MLTRRRQLRWTREIGRRLTHPLALLPWLAVVLSFAVGSTVLGVAVVPVIVSGCWPATSLRAGAAEVGEHAGQLADGLVAVLGQDAFCRATEADGVLKHCPEPEE